MYFFLIFLSALSNVPSTYREEHFERKTFLFFFSLEFFSDFERNYFGFRDKKNFRHASQKVTLCAQKNLVFKQFFSTKLIFLADSVPELKRISTFLENLTAGLSKVHPKWRNILRKSALLSKENSLFHHFGTPGTKNLFFWQKFFCNVSKTELYMSGDSI